MRDRMPDGNPTRNFYEHQYRAGEEIPRTNKLLAIRCLETDERLRVLDVGCGTGMNSDGIVRLGHDVVGVDIAESAVEKYCARGYEGYQGDLDSGLPFDDGSFTAVFCAEVIEHTIDPNACLRELRRVLCPGGVLVLTTPNSAFWAYRLFGLAGRTVSELQHPQHLHFFSRRSLAQAIEGAGLGIERMFGRNMYLIVPAPKSGRAAAWLRRFGFQEESRFVTGKPFFHVSSASSRWNSLFADTLIVVGRRPGGVTTGSS